MTKTIQWNPTECSVLAYIKPATEMSLQEKQDLWNDDEEIRAIKKYNSTLLECFYKYSAADLMEDAEEYFLQRGHSLRGLEKYELGFVALKEHHIALKETRYIVLDEQYRQMTCGSPGMYDEYMLSIISQSATSKYREIAHERGILDMKYQLNEQAQQRARRRARAARKRSSHSMEMLCTAAEKKQIRPGHLISQRSA